MELNRETIKSLSSETRVDILKSLARRRKMPAELSKEFSLAASTISEHLKNLESSRLIQKKETGHKWIYYELTEKGQTLVKPQYTPQFVVVLVLGGLIFLAGFAGFLSPQQSFDQLSLFETNIGQAPVVKNMESAMKSTPGNSEANLATGNISSVDRAFATENVSQEIIQENDFMGKTIQEKTEELPKISLVTLVLMLVGMWTIIIAFFVPKKYRLEV